MPKGEIKKEKQKHFKEKQKRSLNKEDSATSNDTPVQAGSEKKHKDKQRHKEESRKRTSSKVDNEQLNNVEAPSKKRKKENADESKNGVPESKMSKRQLKRERHAQRMAEAEDASHKAVQTQALSYLSLWKHNKQEWKFNKVKQIWLHKNKFSANKIPEELWRPFLEYFAAASASFKQLLIQDSQKVIAEMEKCAEKEDSENKPTDFAYERARDILQNIQE